MAVDAGALFLWRQLALEPGVCLLGLERVGTVAVEALIGALAFAAGRQRQFQLSPTLGADRGSPKHAAIIAVAAGASITQDISWSVE
jgi:hypothetical protein